ncbi:MAG TPA: class I SAM-dependent methyltransferase [Noviherbaspirillum sp.]|nr:class I SAM-dependent methyltransferase [Noviherbaspirillum sp.]
MSDSADRTPSPARLTPEEAVALWNGRYREPDYIFGTEPNAYLRGHTGLWQPGQRVLCVADGEGRNSVWLARHGLAVDAFDISDVGVTKAKRLAQHAGVSVNFQVCDCEQYEWPAGAYDGVVAIFVQFADPAMRARLFANMVNCLKPGGILLLQGYTPQQLHYKTGGPSAVENLYTEDMLRAAFSQMEIIELRAYEDDLSEGNHHRGRSALIGLVACKR